jgi:hypothetical protein
MPEGGSCGGGKDIAFPVQMPHEDSHLIVFHPVAQDQIMHATTDVDRIDLDVTEMGESRSRIGNRNVPSHRPPCEAARGQRGDGDLAGHRNLSPHVSPPESRPSPCRADGAGPRLPH